METCTEPARDVPVLGAYDVVVCGGGPAGCAAALGAARHGARTLLVEKEGYLGGAPCTQFVCALLSTNGIDFQGVWHRYAARLHARRALPPLHRAPNTLYPRHGWWRSSVDPEGVKRVWDELLHEAGASCLHYATVTGVVREGAAVTGVILHTRAGPGAVRAGVVVDATGEGTVSHLAGASWHRGIADRPWPQAVSLVYRLGGQAPERPGGGGTVGHRLERLARIDRLEVDPLDPWSVSEAVRALRIAIWQREEGRRDPCLTTAPELGIRASRIVRGRATVSDEDAWDLRKRTDGIARVSWELDVHPPAARPPEPRMYHSRSEAYASRLDRIAAGGGFDIPYGALVPEGVEGMLTAGRIVSAGYLAQGALRIQQTCMATGEAAGVAAALSLKEGGAPSGLDPARLTARLAADRDVEPAFECLKDLPCAGDSAAF